MAVTETPSSDRERLEAVKAKIAEAHELARQAQRLLYGARQMDVRLATHVGKSVEHLAIAEDAVALALDE